MHPHSKPNLMFHRHTNCQNRLNILTHTHARTHARTHTHTHTLGHSLTEIPTYPAIYLTDTPTYLPAPYGHTHSSTHLPYGHTHLSSHLPYGHTHLSSHLPYGHTHLSSHLPYGHTHLSSHLPHRHTHSSTRPFTYTSSSTNLINSQYGGGCIRCQLQTPTLGQKQVENLCFNGIQHGILIVLQITTTTTIQLQAELIPKVVKFKVNSAAIW